MSEDRRCHGRDPGNGDFAGEGGIAQDLRSGVEITEGIGSHDHDGFLWVAGNGVVGLVRVVRMRRSAGNRLLGRRWEGVGEEKLSELALTEGNEVWLRYVSI